MEWRDAAVRWVDVMERLIITQCDQGWLIEKHRGLYTKVLGCTFLEIPVLCPHKATAARLADATYAEFKPSDQLTWFYMQVEP
jgi:hypothetical protein